MQNILFIILALAVQLLSQDQITQSQIEKQPNDTKQYILNLTGIDHKENTTIVVNFEPEKESGKVKADQRIDIRNNPNFKSLKVLTASGLKGTLKDEREIIVYYKTSLEVSGLKIRNLYKVGHTRVYGDESNISITFDQDHYQNIVSYLRYHNIKGDVIEDINNMYGTWEEIE
jgi:ribosomal 50S subunit-recycling heat shock protein